MLIYVPIVHHGFHSTEAELISCDKDQIAYKAHDIYYLTLCRKIWQPLMCSTKVREKQEAGIVSIVRVAFFQ